MLKVTDKTQNVSGYWGAVDTTTNFCEPHYSLSPYVAEFFNSCSSFVYVVVGTYLIYKLRKDKAVLTSALWLVAIGFGSALFHGTMRYSMQLADELPMVGFVLSGMLAKTTVTFHEGVKKWSKHIRIAGCCQALLLVVLYGYFRLYDIFVNGFALLVVSDVVLGHVLNTTTAPGPHVERRKTAWLYAVVFIILGRIVWETENMYCRTNPQIWPMHSLWHFLSATSAYNSVVFVCLCRMDESQQLPNLIGWTSDAKTTKNMR